MKKAILTTAVLALAFAGSSQDYMPSQTTADNVVINPALAGNDNQGRLALSYRNQWPQLSGNYVTYSGNFYQYLPKLNGYGGIRWMSDIQANTIYTNTINLFYGQNINLGNVLIRPAIEIGYGQRKLDWSKLTFGDMIDPQQGFIYQTGEVPLQNPRTYLDINAGIVGSYKKLTLGASVHHINRPNVSVIMGEESVLPERYGVQASYVLEFKSAKLKIAPNVLYAYQNGFQNLRGGLAFLYRNHYNMAVSYANRDSFIFGLGYKNDRFVINYSYDFTVSRLNNGTSGGAHELSFILKFWKRDATKKLLEVNSVFQ